jgi:hypothetical protein
MYDRFLKEKWSIPYRAHHQVNFTKNSILLLAYDFVTINNIQFRTDTLLVLNYSGKITKQFRITDHLETILQASPADILQQKFKVWPTEGEDPSGIANEITHINSFYQIPMNKYASTFAPFQPGNYIINELINKKIYVLSSDLKRILWQLDTQSVIGDGGNVHDVQVLENGSLLFYSNRSENPNKYSTIDSYDPIHKKLTHLFIHQPPQLFFSKSKGGVQVLKNGNILFSDITSGLKVYESSADSQQKVLWEMDVSGLENVVTLNRVRRYNLTDFLTKNITL